MKIEKAVEISKLFDIYGNLLTEKQQQILSDYYYSDISFSEIAENNKISRQAVKDAVDKGEKLLNRYEKKLGISQKLDLQREVVGKLDLQTKEKIKELLKIWEE